MKATREEVYQAIDEERDYEDALWGEALTEGQPSTGEFLLYIEEYAQRARHDLTQFADPKGEDLALHGIRKIAGMCVACLEQNGVRRRDMRDLNTQRYREHGIAWEAPKPDYDGAPYSASPHNPLD